MHAAILHSHNLVRWIVLALGVLAVLRAFQGLSGDRPYAATRKFTAMFMGALHLQLLLGLLLFLFSPTVKAAMRDMAAVMADAATRKVVIEHPTVMVIAAILMTVGSLVAKNAATDAARHRLALIFSGITMALVLWGIPWQRALFPGM
ncbi:MAG: hypothetical protein KF709_01460 [Gemmatimonadaceae bacterium]|nr:hypothetical protein [Gemmatimonadaceae bacterium]